MATTEPPPPGAAHRSSSASAAAASTNTDHDNSISKGSSSGGKDERPPLPSTSSPYTFACACLNVTVAGRVPDDLRERLDAASAPSTEHALDQVWLPQDAETIVKRDMVTFELDNTEDAAGNFRTNDVFWRKCWVCNVKLYRTPSRHRDDNAPVDTWVEVDFASGIMYGKSYEATLEKPPLPFTGLRLDLPLTSSFGRPPRESTPQPYPPGNGRAIAIGKLLPPLPDPFFLPPPFIPSHAVLRDMCKAAVETLHVKHDAMQRDIAQYIAERTADMHRLEDQVRAEVESLWTRYSEGPGAGDLLQRRESHGLKRVESGNVSSSRDRSRSPAVSKPVVARGRVDSSSSTGKPSKPSKDPIPTTDLDMPSGVTISPPRLSGQYNAHTAANNASLLSASLSANAFHAPPSTRSNARTDAELMELTKTMSNEGVPREVAMSYAFSAMDEYMAVAGGKKVHRQEEKVAENIEEEQEERDKGIDSWINYERAQAVRRAEGEEAKEKETATEEKKEEEGKERKSRVTFSEPFKQEKNGTKEEEVGEMANGVEDSDSDDDDEDEPVFELETEDKPSTPLHSTPSPFGRRRTIVEDNLSRAFAADAPSHRAAWRQWEARESMSTALRRQSSDEEDDSTTDTFSMARSMPVNIVKPLRAPHPVQYKTSLTDRGGVIVPNLLAAMRRASGQLSEVGEGEASPSPTPGDRVRGSIAIAGAGGGAGRGSGAGLGMGQRRGSRTVSGERERDQVKSYAADPGAAFESLAEGAVSASDEEDEESSGGRFVPPHVLAAKRDDKAEVGWRSLAT